VRPGPFGLITLDWWLAASSLAGAAGGR
jgi:hypothetical protein